MTALPVVVSVPAMTIVRGSMFVVPSISMAWPVGMSVGGAERLGGSPQHAMAFVVAAYGLAYPLAGLLMTAKNRRYACSAPRNIGREKPGRRHDGHVAREPGRDPRVESVVGLTAGAAIREACALSGKPC